MNQSIKEKLLKEKTHDFESLLQLVETLRSPGGCPWDIEQTHQSIRSDLIEETYEVVEAIDTDDAVLLREELGDLLFQVIFHCDMEREKGTFTVSEVIDDICGKMISRHPHVFASAVADTSDAVLEAWDKNKKEEKQRLTVKDEMAAVPNMLPALMRTQKVTGKAMKNGYTFDYESDMTDEALVEELFRCAVLLKKRGINAEEQLTKKVNAFIENYQE